MSAVIESSRADGAEAPREAASAIIQSVVMAMDVLDTLAAAQGPMRLTAIANQLGETKAKTYRHLATLKFLGVVDQNPRTECYGLGHKLVALGQAASDRFDLRQTAAPYLQKLRDLTGQTAVLSMPVAGDAIVASVAESASPVLISVRLGYRLPAHASAQGRIALAFSPRPVQQRILARKLPALTPHTVTQPADLQARLARIRAELFETAVDETVLGVGTLAAPIMNFDDELVGVIAIVGTTQHVREPADPEQLRILRSCAGAISGKLNSSAYERLGVPPMREFALG